MKVLAARALVLELSPLSKSGSVLKSELTPVFEFAAQAFSPAQV